MPSSMRRIGVIGVGFGAQVHVPAFRSEGWEVAAICSRSREKAQKAAAEASGDKPGKAGCALLEVTAIVLILPAVTSGAMVL